MKRKPRWAYLYAFIVIMLTQVFILYTNKWNFYYTYSYKCNSFGIVTLVWLHLLWGVYNLVEFINYNTNKDENK